MNCCVNCFNSIYLKSIINSYNKKGKCDFCKPDDVSIHLAKELADYFRNIFSLYEVSIKSELDISASIKKDFNLTMALVVDKKFLFKSIFVDEIEDFNHLFENQVSSNILQEETKVHNIPGLKLTSLICILISYKTTFINYKICVNLCWIVCVRVLYLHHFCTKQFKTKVLITKVTYSVTPKRKQLVTI